MHMFIRMCVFRFIKNTRSFPEQYSEFSMGEQLANGGLRWKDEKTRTHLASDVLSEHLLIPQGDSGLTECS